jgi:hypothetical protein
MLVIPSDVPKWWISPFSNPFPVYSHTHAWLYEYGGRMSLRNFDIHLQVNTMSQNYRYLHISTLSCLRIYVTKCYIFWDITTFSPLKVNRRFGGTCRLHLQSSVCHLLENIFLPSLFFEDECGGDMFLRNLGWLPAYYTVPHPSWQTLHNNRREVLISYINVLWSCWCGTLCIRQADTGGQ